MATNSGNQQAGINPKLPTWNGEWRTYSDYRLAVELEADGSKEEELQYLGPRLVRNLSGRAWESCIEIDREKLKTKAGFEYLLQFLREKRGKQQVDLLGDALGKCFQPGEAVREDAESLSDYELRHGALLRDMTKAMKEVGASNTVPSEIFGWFVLNQFIRLDPSDVATVKAQASSYKLEDVMASLQKMWGGESLAEKDQEKKRQYRAVLGALSWRGTQSAPWICASVSHLQGAFTTASVGDLCHLNKLVRLQRRFSEDPLVFRARIGEPMLVTFCDASWASRKDGSSQGGMLTVLANSSILDLSVFAHVAWQSRKLPRVARSSTSAAVQMASSSTDTHEFIKQIMLDWFNKETIESDEVDSAMRQVESVLVCDSRNLYDALAKIESSGLHLEEKRTAIEVLSIRKRTKAAGIVLRWVDGDQQLADGLSKNNEYDQLIEIFRRGAIRLVFDPQFVSAKKKRAASRRMTSRDGDSQVTLQEDI